MKKIIKGFLTILFLCLTVSSVSVKAATDDKGRWTKLADNKAYNGLGNAIVVLNNKIYTANKVNNMNVIEEFNPVADKWIPKTNMISTKRVSSLQVVNNKIYAICEGDNNIEGVIEEYDLETNKCIFKIKIPLTYSYKDIGIVNNKIYFFNASLKRMEEYDPQTNLYSTKATINKTFLGNYSTVVANSKIYVIGGSKSNKIDEYDPETNKWTTKADMSKIIFSTEVAVLNNKIYIIGGETSNEPYSNIVEEYDLETNKCTVKTSMSSKRYWHQVAVLNDKIYAIGGQTDKDSFLTTVEEYDPETNEWTSKSNMNVARNRHKAVVSDNKIYVFGGAGDASNTAEVFTQETESENSLSISLDKTSITLLEGETDTLTATITPKDASNKKIIWTSSDESIATVDGKGNVTAVKKGQAKITAKIDGANVSASCDVNVTTDGDGDSKPEINSNSGILSITLVNGITKDYDLSANEITKFTKWYDASNGKGQVRYGFNKKINPYKTVKEYIVFDKIASFEIREYNAEK